MIGALAARYHILPVIFRRDAVSADTAIEGHAIGIIPRNRVIEAGPGDRPDIVHRIQPATAVGGGAVDPPDRRVGRAEIGEHPPGLGAIVDRVDTGLAVDEIAPRAAIQQVVSGAAIEGVVVGATAQRIVTAVADQSVRARPAGQAVMPITSAERVIPL